MQKEYNIAESIPAWTQLWSISRGHGRQLVPDVTWEFRAIQAVLKNGQHAQCLQTGTEVEDVEKLHVLLIASVDNDAISHHAAAALVRLERPGALEPQLLQGERLWVDSPQKQHIRHA